MANNSEVSTPVFDVRPMSWAVAAYVLIVVGTVIALVVLSSTSPALATDEAWGHAVVVAVFAVLLPIRLRAARRDRGAVRAVAIIAGVLVAVNVVEAALPGVFPDWMRVEMVLIAALMLVLASLAARAVRRAEC